MYLFLSLPEGAEFDPNPRADACGVPRPLDTVVRRPVLLTLIMMIMMFKKGG
jgi:hypothetical protein